MTAFPIPLFLSDSPANDVGNANLAYLALHESLSRLEPELLAFQP